MISLFHEEPQARRGISGVALSFLLHGAGTGLVWYGVLHLPRVDARMLTERYTVRHLQLHTPSSAQQDGDPNKIVYPGKQALRATLESLMEGDASNSAQQSIPQPPQTADAGGGKQTILQPEFQTHADLAVQTPLPTVVIWTPELASQKQIVAPHPDMPTASTTKPSIDVPNEELNLADNTVAANPATPQLMTLPAGTTTPVITKAPALLAMAPATISISKDRPTPTAVLSISDLRMPDGELILPPVNEIKKVILAPQPTPAPAPQKGPGAAVLPGNSLAAAMSLPNSAAAAKQTGTGKTAQGQTEGLPAAGDLANTAHIQLPRNGQFSVVVVGSSLSEEYPETLQIWNDRTAYTAYLHVGLAKNWILQYAQARSADVQSQGSGGRLEAPWPYDIFRPNLISGDLSSDALLIHGVVNEEGRFEKLAVAFPADFDHASFVLHALQRWQFRPARQNGKPTSVEVVLIIPDELD